MPRTGWLAVGAAVGALAVSGEDRRAVVVLSILGGAALLTALWMPARRRTAILALALGVVAIAIRAGLGPSSAELSGAPGGGGPWTMVVETVGSPRDGDQVATIRTATGGSAGFRLAATLPRYPSVEPGDRLVVAGRTRPRPDTPYGRYLERLGAWGTLDARSMEVLARPTDPGTILEGWRRDAGELLTRVLPEPEAGLAAGILIGLRDRVDRAVAADFATAGVSHVVAISGWNIAIVAAAVGAVAGRLGRRRRAVVTALAVVSYIVFAGASPSVLRAGAMAGVVLLARESGRSGRAAAALGMAAFVLLLAEPSLVHDAGFQLSTLATAGLVAWATPLTDRLDRLTRGHLPRWLAESLGVSLAAQAATLPIVLASFGRLAVISPVVNLLVVPLVTPAMAAGLIALIAGALVSAGAPSILGAVIAAPGWVSLRIMIGIVEGAAAVPFGSVAFDPAIGVALGVGTAALGLGVMALRGRRRLPRRARAGPRTSDGRPAVRADRSAGPGMASRTATMSLVVAVAVAGAVVVSRPAGVARVTILDVGQGDAILIEGSRGGRLLIDGGPDPDRLLVELDRRIPPWDRRIDAVVLSHPHEDHVAGLALLLERYRVSRVLEPGMRGPGPGYAAWLDRLGRPGAPARHSIGAGDRLSVDDVAMRVLWPVRGQVPDEPPDTGTGINNVSVVLLGVVGERRFLLTGDVEEDVDPSLLTKGLPRVDLLKVAHHGSRTATTDAFLAAVRPRVAVASAGADNPYGHPARPTLERLAAAGARVYRTDVDGSVTVTFGAEGLSIGTQPRRDATAKPRSVVTTGPRLAAAATGGGPQPSFLCAIPDASRAPEPARDRQPIPPTRPFDAGSGREGLDLPGVHAKVRYHRLRDRPWARGCRGPALLPGSPRLVRRALARRGRGRGLSRGTDRGERDPSGPAGGRVGRPAPRRRQGVARERSGTRSRPWARLCGVAHEAGPPGARTVGRSPPRHPAARWGSTSALGGLREPRGADRRLCRQASRSAARVDGGALRLVAATLPGWVGCGDLAGRLGSSTTPGSRGLPGGRGRTGRGPAPEVDREPDPRGAGASARMIPPLLYVWGDDELVAERLISRFSTALAGELGSPLERWDLRGDLATAAIGAAQLHERLATAVLFGGGTLAVVTNPGALVRRNDTRDRVLEAISMLGVGNAVAFVEAAKSGAKTPGSKRLVEAVKAAGGAIRQATAPRPSALGAWIESEARDRGLPLAPGAARALADRLGSRVTEGDVDRRYLSRIASGELDKLALRHAIDGGPVTADDVHALVAESTPGSVWALTDAVGERRTDAALTALDRLIDTTPEPVLLAVLHRRVVELLELGDRLAGGTALPVAARAMGIASEYRAKTLAGQTRHWTTAELTLALERLVELDALVKGAPGSEADAAQRRLAFTMWVRDHAARDGPGDVERRAGPG